MYFTGGWSNTYKSPHRLFSDSTDMPCHDLGHIFTPNGFWRDLVALSADIRTLHPRSSIQSFLMDRSPSFQIRNLELLNAEGRTLVDSLTVIQGTFALQTCVGRCFGVFTLVPTILGVWKALSVVIGLEGLHNSRSRFIDGLKIGQNPFRHVERPRIVSERPRVGIIGAGQAGISVAARLEDLGIRTVIIERRGRVGDSWRSRYESLYMNTPRNFSHMPFVPFPQEWPMFPSSDAVADHLEAYPRVLGLHVLTSTVVLDTRYDSESGAWTVRVRQSDGEVLTFKPQHLVLATGVDNLAGSVPKIPNIPNANQFQGKTLHFTEFINGKVWAGKKAIVIGAGCSGHDIAQELHRQGASVTLVQRSSTAVVSRKMLLALFPDLYTGDNQPPTPVADRLFLFPNKHYPQFLDHLRQTGFILPDEGDNFFERLMIRRGGYYIDQGCSSLIIENKARSCDIIEVKAGVPITAYTPSGLMFKDGTVVQANLVVYATGISGRDFVETAEFQPGRQSWDTRGWDAEYETAGVWRPTGHRGLWFAGGDFFTCLFYSRLLAMQIKAQDDNLFKTR
ncbi:hypothetical protein JB92DRAFT_3085585 [Gautieria morchelliformis]|nr:hypothetical protein JB92DRAFT_3085585 [Gautieria morchelliformis]